MPHTDELRPFDQTKPTQKKSIFRDDAPSSLKKIAATGLALTAIGALIPSIDPSIKAGSKPSSPEPTKIEPNRTNTESPTMEKINTVNHDPLSTRPNPSKQEIEQAAKRSLGE